MRFPPTHPILAAHFSFFTALSLLLLSLGACGNPQSQGEDPWAAREGLMVTEELDPGVFKFDQAAVEEEGMKRENVDLSTTTIRYFTTKSPDEGQLRFPPEAQALAVVDCGPTGELPIEASRPTIYVMFNNPMVPLGKLGEPIDQVPWVHITPPLEGVWRWYGTRTLSFQPRGLVLDNPLYTITVDKAAAGLGGRSMEKEFSFRFNTESVKVVNFWLGEDANVNLGTWNIPLEAARHIVLEFNQEVDPAHIATFISVDDEGGGQFNFTVRQPEYPEALANRSKRAIQLNLDQTPSEDREIRIHLADGISPKPGYPEHKGADTRTFRTIRPFTFQSAETWSWDAPRNNLPSATPVYLDFSQTIKGQVKAGSITVFKGGKRLKPASVETFGSTVRINLEGVSPGDELKISADSGIQDEYSRPLANPGEARTITLPSPYSYFSFPGYYLQHLEAKFQPKLIWEARNIQEFFLKRQPVDSWTSVMNEPNPKHPGSQWQVDMSGWKTNKVHYGLEDLQPWLNQGGFGTLLFQWLARWDLGSRYISESSGRMAVQVTDLGISTRFAWNRILVWVNSLSTGKPVAQATVTAGTGSQTRTAQTDSQGLAVIELAPGEFQQIGIGKSIQLYLSARKGEDFVELPTYNSHDSWGASIYGHVDPEDAEKPRDRILVFTDRGLYKPGEELAFRGIHWIQTLGSYQAYQGPWTMKLMDSDDGSTLWQYSDLTTESGGLASRLTLPRDLDPGEYYLHYEANGQASNTYFTIAQFRRLAFQVRSSVADRTYYQGDNLDVEVAASYLAGGPLPQAQSSWYWTRSPRYYSPPGSQWQGWVFGTETWEGEHNLESGEARLGANGTIHIAGSTAGQNADGSAYEYQLETTVQDIDRQQISSRASVLVHPAAFYIGARFAEGSSDGWWSRFIATGQNVRVQVALGDPRGKVVPQDRELTVRLVKGSWKSTQQQGVYGRIDTRWEYVEEEVKKDKLRLSKGTGDWNFKVEEAGTWLIYLETRDDQDRLARTLIRCYASGSDWVRMAGESPSTINLVLDKPEYLPGETARILVQTPIAEGDYLLTVEREGLVSQKIIHLKGSQNLIEVPVKAELAPVFYVALTGFTTREAPPTDYFEPDIGKPRGLFGICGVQVSTKALELQVAIDSPKDTWAPGEEATVEVTVTREGKPVANAELTLVGVDRGVLDLIDYHIPDPLDFFYSPWNFPLGVHGDDSRRLLLKPVTFNTDSLTGGDDSKLKERSDFRPLAIFEPFARTDARGKATVRFRLPDNLTTYRLTALALSDQNLGYQENEMLVQNPVNMRTALPRRLRNRDTAVAGVILNNLGREEIQCTVSLAATGVQVAGETSKTVTIGPRSVIEVPFVIAASQSGEASLEFTLRSPVLNEVLKEQLTVEQPLVKEAFTTTGIAEAGKEPQSEGLLIPKRINPGYGSLEIQAGSSYRIFAEAALQELLGDPQPWWSLNRRIYRAFALVWQNQGKPELTALMADLASRQLEDGGIYTGSWTWSPYLPSEATSLLTAWLIQFARSRSYILGRSPDENRLLRYLGTLKSLKDDADWVFQTWLSMVLASWGRNDIFQLDQLAKKEDSLGLGGYGMLAQAYILGKQPEKARKIWERCKNFMTIGTQQVDLKETYEARSYWSSMIMELALMLKNTIDLKADSQLELLLARSLNAPGRHWQTQADQLWTLLALLPLIDQEKPSNPKAGLDLMQGDQILGKLDIGPSETQGTLDLPLDAEPLSALPRDSLVPVKYRARGNNRIFWTSIFRYALPNETAFARDEGLEVYVQWEDLEGRKVGPRELKPGQTYRVRCTLGSTSQRDNLELRIPIPSGAEILDPSFVTTSRFATSGGNNTESWNQETVYGDSLEVGFEGEGTWDGFDWDWYWYRPETQALDNMMVYRWADFYAGSREVSFLVRATTPGIYPTPPASASLEFQPEVFGRSDGVLFVIRP